MKDLTYSERKALDAACEIDFSKMGARLEEAGFEEVDVDGQSIEAFKGGVAIWLDSQGWMIDYEPATEEAVWEM